jgi:hypothetical protein
VDLPGLVAGSCLGLALGAGDHCNVLICRCANVVGSACRCTGMNGSVVGRPGGVSTKTCRRAWTSTLMPRQGPPPQAPTSSNGVPHRAPLCWNLHRTGHMGHPVALGSSELRRSRMRFLTDAGDRVGVDGSAADGESVTGGAGVLVRLPGRAPTFVRRIEAKGQGHGHYGRGQRPEWLVGSMPGKPPRKSPGVRSRCRPPRSSGRTPSGASVRVRSRVS